jgi:hypothetical protein
LFNSFLIILYLFIISKIKNKDIGYINNIIIYKKEKINEFEINNINEIIKNEK